MSQLVSEYTLRFNAVLKISASSLKDHLESVFSACEGICWITTRAKTIDSFLSKAGRMEGSEVRYQDPLNEIQDQVGALIITRFLSDVQPVEQVLRDHFGGIEQLDIEPESETEFGYVGKHQILFMPTEVTNSTEMVSGPEFFELQIKTLFQYAWSETNHAIGYKSEEKMTSEQKRLSAFVAAQAWGADQAIDNLKRAIEEPIAGDGKHA